MPIQVVLADDHEVVRLGIRTSLEASNIFVVGEADSGESAVHLAQTLHPDLLLLDVRMPGVDGLTALGRIKLDRPEQPVLMLSAYENPMYMARAVALGANGYFLKGGSIELLVDAVRTAASGQMVWTPREMRRISSALATPRPNVRSEVALTLPESDVLKVMAEGYTNEKIAAELGLSYETVKDHVQSILRKVGVTDRTQAAVWAVRSGVL